jgi:transposase InsO family protein
MARQNFCCSSLPTAIGRPGERIAGRPDSIDLLQVCFRIARPHREVLLRPVEFTPYASDDYRAELRANRVRRSMSRKGDCWDNAVAESFFATIRAELVDHERYATRAAAMKSIGDYIDNFYNAERRHSYLGYLNPIEFELRAQLQQQVA